MKSQSLNRWLLTGLLCLTSVFGVRSVQAADLIVPSGSTLNLNTGTLNIDDLDLDGTIVVTTGTINATGDWDNAGTFTSGTGTVNLTGTDQTFVGASTFYNLNKTTASSTLTFPASIAQTVDGGTLTLKGTGVGTELILQSSAPPTRWQFNLRTGSSQDIEFVDVRNSEIVDNTGAATGATGLDLVAVNSLNTTNNDDGEGDPMWIFGATTMTWTGAALTSDWSTNGNWDLGIAPGATDHARIPAQGSICGGCVMPILTADVTVDRLSLLDSTSTVTLDGNDLTVTDASSLPTSGTLSNEGFIRLIGTETVTIDTFDTDSGTFEYIGDGDGTIDARTILDLGTSAYFNVEIDSSGGGTADTYALPADITVAGTFTANGGTASTSTFTLTATTGLTVSGGTFNASSGNLDVNGSVVISSGTLTAPGAGQTFNVANDWTFSGGTFTANNGTVTFDTTTTTTLSGSTTFSTFQSQTGGKIIEFPASPATTTVTSSFDIDGASGNEIVLRSTNTTVDTWLLAASSDQTVSFANVSDGNATVSDINCLTCTNTANNDDAAASPHWIFVSQLSGVAFDSEEDFAVLNASLTLFKSDGTAAVVGTDLASTDSNPVTTTANGSYSFRPVSGSDYRIVVSAAGFDYPSAQTNFPATRTIITGSKGELFTMTNTSLNMDQPLDFNGQLIRIEKSANKNQARVGEIVTYTIEMENVSSTTVSDVLLEDNIPAGFKYVDQRVILDDVQIPDPIGSRPLDFSVGSFAAGQTKILKYQLVIGSGVVPGDYNNSAIARLTHGQRVSNRASEKVEVVMDPLFDLGTIIGKVFYDRNENGVQDAPEYIFGDRETISEDPVPNVRIVMEDGTIVTSDRFGKFSIPALTPGRHLFRVDERTLPQGSYLTTDKVVIVDVTEGLLAKVNFGINVDYQQSLTEGHQFFDKRVKITQEREKPEPRLHVKLYQDQINTYNEAILDKLEFRIFTNYSAFISFWRVEVYDIATKRTVKTFEGNRFNIHEPIYWDGRDKKGDHIDADREYEYLLYVEDEQGNYNETKPLPIVFKELNDEIEMKEYLETERDNRNSYLQWAKEQNKIDNTQVSTMYIDGETVLVDRIKTNLASLRIYRQGELYSEVPIVEKQGLTAKELLDGRMSEDVKEENLIKFILPRGDYEMVLQEEGSVAGQEASGPAIGEPVIEYVGGQPPKGVKTFAQPINIGEDYLFMVAMGDAKLGYTMTRGNIEPVQHEDKFTDGFWAEGKLAYYLQGKILGKYLVTSSLDTDRERKELFRNLDPEDYYPVYGDESTVDYDATDTQGNLYLLIEWDKSSVQWGNYEVLFDDTEFAQFSRTLYGGKIDYESLSSTKFGDARSKFVVFRAQAQQKSAHNELLATGGSLYFLKHKDIIEGSDKIKIEIRDKITGLVISEREMDEGADYEIDYSSGRVIFWRPVPVLIESYSIISDQLLDGNLVYVTADYEYEAENNIDEPNIGARIRQAVTDNVLVGTTYVKESLDQEDFELRGADVTVKFTEDASITAEYAESTSEAQGSFVSTDGGLSFTELTTEEGAQGVAYGLSGDAKLFNRLGVTSYYKWIDNDFSTSATTAQQGKELYGFGLVADIDDQTRVTVRQDVQKLIDDGNLQTQLQVGANRTSTSLVQIVHDSRRLRLTGEYRRTSVSERLDQFDSETNKEEDIIAVRAEYDVNEKLELALEQQIAIQGEGATQTTIGVTARPTDALTLRAEEVIGSDGTATKLGVTADMNEKLELSGDYAISTDPDGLIENTATVGALAKLNEQTEVRTSVGVTTPTEGASSTTVSLGGRSQLDDDTSIQSEVALTDAQGESTTTIEFGGTARVDEKTETEGKVAVSESSEGGQNTSFSFGTRRKITDEIELVTSREFGDSSDGDSISQSYGLARVKDNKRIEGKVTREYADEKGDVSKSNIFGLTGEIDDRWAVTGTYEQGEVQNLDGSETDRDVVSLAAGYVKKDPETQEEVFKSSSKLEVRFDKGEQDLRQYLFFNATEGRLTEELTVFSKFEVSRTRNRTLGLTEAQYREIVIGGAYRPIMHDQLNLIGRYTWLQDQGPSGQADITDVEEERAQIFAAEGIYDINDKWQVSEKLAIRIAEEKVAGFDFTKTHTWLMIHRLNYKVDQDWTVGGEFRSLTQIEAEDQKRGFLIEAARRVGEYAQIGIGYNFTDFDDDLTDLDYTAHGPFIRITGKFYDRTPEEIERARQRWLELKMDRWAWAMVTEELTRFNSPILSELNDYFIMAEIANAQGKLEEAKRIYKDIIVAADMMHQEAKEFIRGYVLKEEKLKENMELADEYIRNGEYKKARKILEKVLDEAQNRMLE